ncbi:hypothetical protein [Bacillus toyonensis]|uniref:hypothetical protein n=1 Tax=Bacillus toyonensis TaxID=155322 RepID=UPI000BFDF5ED|nr:hypothetical protein [Bacillus toyonensis]PHD33042.1 hypothetical protein COF48_19140 [Bacillus toyonensis]
MLSIDDVKKGLEYGREVDVTQAKYTDAFLKYQNTVNTSSDFFSEKFKSDSRGEIISLIKGTDCPVTKVRRLETLHVKICTYNDNFKNDECMTLIREFNQVINDVWEFFPQKTDDYEKKGEKGTNKLLKFFR